MKGTTISATRAIWRMPPKITTPESSATGHAHCEFGHTEGALDRIGESSLPERR